MVKRRTLTAVVNIVLLLSGALLASQFAKSQGFWLEDAPKIPMAPSWQLEKTAYPLFDPPRMSDGVPDLEGHWSGPGGDGLSYIEDHDFVDVTTPAQESFLSDPPDGKIPYTDWGMDKREEILAGLGRGWPGESGERLFSNPSAYCLLYMPRITLAAVEIVQQPGVVYMLGEESFRVIPTDERPRIDDDVKLWFGNSRGYWEDDTLVVEVTNLNGLGWFDSTGHFYTENTRMTERWRLIDEDTIDYEITIEDPSIYSQAWTMNFPRRRPGTGPNLRASRVPSAVAIDAPAYTDPYADEIWEEACFEGNIEGAASLRALGYQWYRGIAPPE